MDSKGGEVHPSGAENGRVIRPFGCPDIARTDLFRSKNLGYVHSRGFVEALHAVAEGRSRYSPPVVPPGWLDTAFHWGMHILAHEMGLSELPAPEGASTAPVEGLLLQIGSALNWERYDIDRESCEPILIHRASLEYRSWPGNEEVGLVLPYYVQIGMTDLGGRVERFTARALTIKSEIARAEQMGARQCAPTALAFARSELAGARRKVTEGEGEIVEIDEAFDKAERSAMDIIRSRQMASFQRFVCFSQ